MSKPEKFEDKLWPMREGMKLMSRRGRTGARFCFELRENGSSPFGCDDLLCKDCGWEILSFDTSVRFARITRFLRHKGLEARDS